MEAKDVTWRKAARSGSNGGGCVAVAFSSDGLMAGMVQDSRSPERGHLAVTPGVFRALLESIKRGELDL